MQVLKLNRKNKNEVLRQAVLALRAGKTVVYPTDTTYGLGALAANPKAVAKIYKIKVRNAKQPIHVLVPSLLYAKKILKWNKTAEKLARKFLPGPLSIVLPIKTKISSLKKLTARSGFLGIRLPKNGFAIELAKKLGAAITATSANPSAHLAGGHDPYSARDVVKQFEKQKYKPDFVIDAGKLPKKKPSTFVKISSGGRKIEILREGPISKEEIVKAIL